MIAIMELEGPVDRAVIAADRCYIMESAGCLGGNIQTDNSPRSSSCIGNCGSEMGDIRGGGL